MLNNSGEVGSNKDRPIYDELSRILIHIGILPGKKGFHYLKKAVILYGQNSSMLASELYKQVGDEFEVSVVSVERCIRTSILGAVNKKSLYKLNDIMGCEVLGKNEYLTNRELIALLNDYIKHSESIVKN